MAGRWRVLSTGPADAHVDRGPSRGHERGVYQRPESVSNGFGRLARGPSAARSGAIVARRLGRLGTTPGGSSRPGARAGLGALLFGLCGDGLVVGLARRHPIARLVVGEERVELAAPPTRPAIVAARARPAASSAGRSALLEERVVLGCRCPRSTSPARASMAARRSRSLRAATFAGAPVPAGMSLPMMTFSLSPIRWSLAPLMAASVSTRVVSWKDAAARKDEVLSDALVTPRSTVWAVAGSPPSDRTRLFASSKSSRSISSVGQQVDVARLVDADLPEHLPDDDLDVLVVDRHALAAVDLLDFLDQVALDGVLAPGVEVLLRVDRAVRDRVAGADLLAVLDEELGVVRDRVLALDDVLGPDGEPVVALHEEALDRRDDVGRRACPCRRRSGRRPGWPRPSRRPRRAARRPSARPSEVS